MNPLLVTDPIDRFLNGFSPKSCRRGHHYFLDKAVVKLQCVEPDHKFLAVVHRGQSFTVTYTYDASAQAWSAECDCPVKRGCKHAYAGMLALKANAIELSTPPTAAAKKSPTRKRKAKASVPLLPQETPQPPPSPLALALGGALGRKLNDIEINYVLRLQWLYRQASAGQSLRPEHLRFFAPGLQDTSWTPLKLWPAFPQDDLQFWLYCAWELRQRGLPCPECLSPVTDFGGIEPAMRAWQRSENIELWRKQLAMSQSSIEREPDLVDLRLKILPREARLQWKTQSEPEFKDLKPTQLQHLCEDQQRGTLSVIPEALPLWLAVYRSYDYYTACNLEYDRAESAHALGRMLRLPSIADRLVTREDLPLPLPAEPLHYQLHAAGDESEDYRLGLVQADGSGAPPILLVSPGRPNLYLTESALFRGPQPHGFDLREPLRIPAPALESANGVNFLNRLALDMPPRLAQRTRRVNALVKLTCEVKPISPASETEAVFIAATAELEGVEAECFGANGWETFSGNGHLAQKSSQPGGNGLIALVDRSAQRHFPGLFQRLGVKWDESQFSWRVRLTRDFPEKFVDWLKAVPPEIEICLDPELDSLRREPVSGSVRLDIEEAEVDWFDLKVVLNVSDTELTQAELRLLLNARGRFVRLNGKGWRRLQFDITTEEDERLARLGLDARDFTAEPQRLHALQLADDAARKLLPEQQAESIRRRADELKTRVTPPLPGRICAQLRPYQLEGFHFLAYLTANHFGGVLADDMGLGKTLQTLTWLEWLRQGSPLVAESALPASPASPSTASDPASLPAEVAPTASSNGEPLPSLVVCPKSVMDNWRAEADRFCPGLRVRLWRGEEAAVLVTARGESDLIVVNYAQLRGLSPQIAQFRWQAAILDEAQSIKNPDSQTAQAARALQAGHRLALTGTPIENRLLDLWSILAFSMPGVLGNRAQFARRFNQQDDPFARRRLAARVRPFLLRRTKGEVAQDLPDRVEEDLICEMEGDQKTLYRAEFKRAQQLLLRVQTQQELNEQRFNFLTSLLRLRQICCHPALISEDLAKADSAKLNALLDLLEPLMAEGHKVLVFSQFVTMLDILRQAVQERGWPHFYLAGDTENRGALVADFQNAPGSAVFLLSLKAGGFGLNLTAASYVVLYDPWWNPAVEMQAIDRTHRIGQTSKVMAYRLLMKDSIEQKIRQLQRAKAALAEDVLGEEKFAQSLTLDDLRFLFADE